MVRGDILPQQIPAQESAVGTFTYTAERDALPPSDWKEVTEEIQSSFFILSFFFFFLLSVFLSPSHVSEDCWMQGSEPLCPQTLLGASVALSPPKGARFLPGVVSGFPTPQPDKLCDGARSV